MTRIASSLRFAAMVTLVLTIPPAAAQAVLDGRKFDVEVGYVGKPAHIQVDILSFHGGKFHSSDCDQYGYNRGDYRATAQVGTVAFETETVSEQYGRNVWKGVVVGDAIEGVMLFHRKGTWLRPNPEPLEHWFKGRATQ